jgi:hypothetical protein
VELTSGATLYYGTSAASQITNASGTQIFRWLLAKSTDNNGNVIEYDYTSYVGSTNQKYLKQIRYAGGAAPATLPLGIAPIAAVAFRVVSRQTRRTG